MRSSNIGQVVILIAPSHITRRIVPLIEQRFEEACEWFDSIPEFDRWRVSNVETLGTIQNEVLDALLEIGVPMIGMSEGLRRVFLHLLHSTSAPEIAELAAVAGSKRSLYRWWDEEMPETPARFLRRLRRLHAERLRSEGISAKEAAHRSGYSSSATMIRELSKGRSASDWHEFANRWHETALNFASPARILKS